MDEYIKAFTLKSHIPYFRYLVTKTEDGKVTHVKGCWPTRVTDIEYEKPAQESKT